MKKTLFTLGMMLTAGVAMSATTAFTDLTQETTKDGLTLTPESFTPGASGMNTGKMATISGMSDGTGYAASGAASGDYHQTSLTFCLNLTQLKQSTGDTLLVNYKQEGSETASIGLMYSAGNGLSFAWEGKKWGTSSYLTDTWIEGNSNVFTVGTDKYITLTMAIGSGGTGIYVGDGSILPASSANAKQYRWSSLKSASDLKEVVVNANYISGIAVTSANLSDASTIAGISELVNYTAPAVPTLTETSVNNAHFADGRVTFQVADDLSAFTAPGADLPLNVTVSEEVLAALIAKMGPDALSLVKISLTDGELPAGGVLALAAGGNTIDLETYAGRVTFNGSYVGEGGGNYKLAYIPEPATATLSLLALAGLAARRRRK